MDQISIFSHLEPACSLHPVELHPTLVKDGSQQDPERLHSTVLFDTEPHHLFEQHHLNM